MCVFSLTDVATADGAVGMLLYHKSTAILWDVCVLMSVDALTLKRGNRCSAAAANWIF